jgi:hypothetical protein
MNGTASERRTCAAWSAFVTAGTRTSASCGIWSVPSSIGALFDSASSRKVGFV